MKKILLTSALFLGAVSNAWALPLLWSDNGNYYDLVLFDNQNLTWHEALAGASGLNYNGYAGHLATITSANENSFLLTAFFVAQNDQLVWIAGYEPNDNGIWRWAAGPESGAQFSNYANPTAPFNYANWGGIEPNDNKPGEDFLMFNIGNTFNGIQSGKWADAIATSNSLDPVIGYFVEYESPKAVPEPLTVFLFGGGVLGLLLRKRNG